MHTLITLLTLVASVSVRAAPSQQLDAGITQERVRSCTKPGFRRCPVTDYEGSNRLDWRCVNVLYAVDSCGGCVGFDEGAVSCAMIEHVVQAWCEKGRCKVGSCTEGYVADGDKCRLAADP